MENEKRLIDANALKEQFVQDYAYAAATMVDDAPTVDAVEVVHGRWERVDESLFRCSACSEWILMQNDWYYYCPNCGAKMEGERKDNAV